MSPRERWKPGETAVTIHGFIGKIRKVSKELTFANIELNNGEFQGQICAKGIEKADALRKIQPYSAVTVTGNMTDASSPTKFDMEIESIGHLNPFPKDIIVSSDAVFPPEARHLQLRFHAKLKESLRFRAFLKASLGQTMSRLGYMDVETPTLFKSTSEGAREFLIPTRRAGHAYALPQSPQQYKQVLMAAGLGGYYQFARCYRDEDHRADRQPEFTQMDLEKSFATGETIQADVEAFMQTTWDAMREEYNRKDDDTSFIPHRKSAPSSDEPSGGQPVSYKEYPAISTPFRRMKYQECMDLYGSDKPDLRIPNRIERVDAHLSPNFVSMITDLERPIVDAWVFRPHEDADRKEVHEFMQNFLQNLHKSHSQNPDGAPQALMYNTSKPLEGFSALGPAGLKTLQDAASPESGLSTLENGDVVVFQARQDRPHQGGSTKLGEVRIALYHAAIEAQLLERDDSFQFLWVTDFPMFTPNEEVDVGQGGSSGFSATHHPFTAPLTVEDLELLFTDPLKAKADHYDLVLNGVELGGGSRRIHVAAMQEFIFRDILQMTKPKMAEFSHLLKALRAGCPPHAGFALGFDRFAAVLSGSSSVRGVIAFPKNNKGVDEFAGGPGKISDEQLKTYHLQLRKK
ncbi:Aspartate--tRNA ligase like protein [Verticillium longisporum]|nr:Aspartate--tRNA ligase like protein [Verticillium longisporum]